MLAATAGCVCRRGGTGRHPGGSAASDTVAGADWYGLALRSNRARGERPGESDPGAHLDAVEDRQAGIVNGEQSPLSLVYHPIPAGSCPADECGGFESLETFFHDL